MEKTPGKVIFTKAIVWKHFNDWIRFRPFSINTLPMPHPHPFFIRPSSDGTYYCMMMSVRPSVRPFSALFSYMLWHNELKFCTWLCFNVLQIKFECRHFASIFEGVMPSDSPSVRPSDSPSGSPSARFPHFSHTCFDILSWNFAHDFVLLYYRSSSSVVNFRQFL